MHLADAIEHRLQLAPRDLAVELRRHRLQREAEHVDDLDELANRLVLDVERRFEEVAEAVLPGEPRRVDDELVPDDGIVVGPRQHADAVREREVDDLFGRVAVHRPLIEMLDLRCLPVVAEAARHHAADVTEAEDAGPRPVVVDRFGLDGLFRRLHRHAVVERVERAADVAAHAAEAGLPGARLAVPRAQMAFDA